MVLAATTILESGDTEAARLHLPGIAEGRTVATLALVEENGRWSEDGIEATAVPDGAGFSISGTKSYVLDGAQADLVVVAARTAAGTSLFTVDAKERGVTATPLPTLDQTRRLATLTFDDTPAQLLGVEGRGWDVLSRVLDIAAAGLACEQVGGAARVLESTVDYVKVREQFGRPVGSFQAVKHKLADMLVELESARSAAYYASSAVESSSSDLPLAASIAKTYCSTAYSPHHGGEHPAPRRDRLHLGAPGAPVLQARQGFRAAARLPRPPPGAHRPAAQPVGPRGTSRRPAGRPDQAQGVPSMVMVLTWVCSSTASAPCVLPNPLLL